MMVRKSALLSSIRFSLSDSTNTKTNSRISLAAAFQKSRHQFALCTVHWPQCHVPWSYSDKATRNMIDVTFSKQWIHLRRSDRWPPTSTIRKMTDSRSNGYSMIPANHTNAARQTLPQARHGETYDKSRCIPNDQINGKLKCFHDPIFFECLTSKTRGVKSANFSGLVPVVGTRARNMSCSVGKKSGSAIRSRSCKSAKYARHE